MNATYSLPPVGHPTVRCRCGVVVVVCWCDQVHPHVKMLSACRLCTATGAQPERAQSQRKQTYHGI